LFFFSTKNINKPSVIIVSSISPLPIFKAYLWAKKYNSKLIFEVRDIWPLSLIELGGFKTYNPFVLILQLTENFAYKVSDYVVSLLPDAFKHMKKHGLSSDRFKHIPNGIDLKMEQLEVCDEIASAIPKNKFVVAYTGAVGIANSLMTLVKAANLMKKNKDIVFIIVGDGSEKKNILEQKDKLGLDNLLLLDPIPKSSVIPFLKKYVDVCYIGLQRQPLFRFGVSPNKMFDYLFSKTPIIQSIDSSNDIVQLSGSGISVEAENPSKIAEAVNTLYNMSKSERDLLGEKGLEYVIENHSYQKLAQHYESLFD
jgi:glycosyltransferase involved in cell wall biosynthesis